MVGRPREDGTRRYVCGVGVTLKSCGGTFIKAEPLEEFVVMAVLERLDSPAMMRAMKKNSQNVMEAEYAEKQIVGARERLNELAEMYGEGEITRAQLLVAQKSAQRQLSQAEKIFAQNTQSGILDGHVGNALLLKQKWSTLNLDRQRAIVGTVLAGLEISGGKSGSRIFDPNRVNPIWRF